MKEELKKLLVEYKSGRKNYKRQLRFLKMGLPISLVRNLKFAVLGKKPKKK